MKRVALEDSTSFKKLPGNQKGEWLPERDRLLGVFASDDRQTWD